MTSKSPTSLSSKSSMAFPRKLALFKALSLALQSPGLTPTSSEAEIIDRAMEYATYLVGASLSTQATQAEIGMVLHMRLRDFVPENNIEVT